MPGDEAPVLSIVVVSWNTRELLRACLDGVTSEAADLAQEVIVVDNASGDRSAEMVAQRFPGVKLIRNPENRGFGAACNQGIEVARGRHVMLLNPDAEPRDGAPRLLAEFLDRHQDVGVVGPRIVTGSGESGLTYGHFPSLTTALLPLLRPISFLLPTTDLHALGVVPPAPTPGAPPRDVDYVCGAAMTLRRSALDRVGGFDPRFFLYFEETDLCRRMRRGGWRVVYLAPATVAHREGASRKKHSMPALDDYYRSLDLYLRKHHSSSYVALVRGAMILGFVLRYVAARLGARRTLADHYLASVRALRSESHA